MFPLKKILCPIDFSKPSLRGLEVAVEMAEQHSAELILVHVVQPVHPVPAPGVPAGYVSREYYEERTEAAEKRFKEIGEEKIPRGMALRTKVITGHGAEEIVKLAQSEKVDLIVTATHGWTGWRRFIFGSVAERVIRLAPCPVLTVPKPAEGGDQ